MSELKYNQIVDKLNTEFASGGRRLVFWYDDNGYFADDVDAMPLQNAKIWHLTPTNQFRTKILLEREDPQSNYLIYAPFPKPPVEQNHLEDTILYSKQFHADPISLLCSDLGIGAEGKAVLQKYAKVVGEQTRKQRFCDYKLAAYTVDNVETALLCTVCKCRTAQFEDALREILLADTPDGNPKLDDLACVWGCTEGFLSAGDSGSLPVLCIFDNEEVGSATKQGAASTFLRDTLRRISLALGQDEESFQTTLARSFLVSADNAHAIHPDHPEYADRGNCPRMNGGVVIKFNANQRYATDGRSCAVFRAACAEAGVPVQLMANRSDLPGGSTLGSIAGTLVPVSTVDIGLAQLAMHSSWETMGAQDCAYLAAAAARIFETEL